MAPPTIIVKLTGNGQIHRWTAQVDQLSFTTLQKRASDLFTTKTFTLTYLDDEADEITVGCDEELQEAIGIAVSSEPSVLRLKLTGQTSPASSPARSKPSSPRGAAPETKPHNLPQDAPKPGADMGHFLESLAAQLPNLLGRLPPHVQSFMRECELDVAASVAANAASTGLHAGYNATTKAAATGLGAAARAAHTAASVAGHASDAAAAAAAAVHAADPNLVGIHPGVSCDKSNVSPIVGIRYNLIGHDYDLCEAEFTKLPADLEQLYKAIPPRVFRRKVAVEGAAKGIHPGVTCDKSGMAPIVGVRYHLVGQDYDLCEAEFAKLPADEQQHFKAIPPPCMPGQGWRRGGGGGGGGGFGGGGGGFGGGFGGSGGFGRCGPWGGPERGSRCRGPFQMNNPTAQAEKAKPSARFISDVTIHEGTQMAGGTPFVKVWRLKNSGNTAWWPGSKLAFVGGDQLSAEQLVAIPSPVMPGQEVDIAVDMIAPQEPGRYVGYWRLTGPMGRRKFGQRVWVHMQVVADANEPARMPTDEELSDLTTAMQLHEHGSEDDDEADEDLCPCAPPAATPMDTSAAASSADAVADKPIQAASTAKLVAQAMDEAEMATAEAPPTKFGARKWYPAPVPFATEAAEARSDPFPLPAAAAVTAELATVRAVEELAEMGFDDAELAASVVGKNLREGAVDLGKCVEELNTLADLEWDSMLDDLHEMGFADRSLNKKVLVETAGSLNKTVKQLALARIPLLLD